MYVCFESYYKHGEVSMQTIASDEEMREYCIDQLSQEDEEKYEEISMETAEMSLDDLIKKTVEDGNKRVENQGGWGVRYIVEGYNIKTY